jgi:hypothetical protein
MVDQGAGPLVINERRLQVLRHKAGQLDSLKRLDWEELDRLRIEQSKKLAILEEQYWQSREGTLQGKLAKQRLGFSKKESDAPSPPDKKAEEDEYTFGATDKSKRRQSKKRSDSQDDGADLGGEYKRRP